MVKGGGFFPFGLGCEKCWNCVNRHTFNPSEEWNDKISSVTIRSYIALLNYKICFVLIDKAGAGSLRQTAW